MGDSPSAVQTPTPPPAPSQTATLQDYIQNYPALVELQKQYAPQLAQLDYEIQQKYQPQQLALGEQLAGQASQGMTQSPPDWYNRNVRDTLASNFGRNMVYNPQGQEAFGLQTSQANEDWKRYYQNMGMSLSNKVPLTQNTMNTAQGYTPQQALSFAAQNYGTNANLYGTQSQNYWNQQNYSPPWMNTLGTLAGAGVGAAGNYFGMGNYANIMKGK